MLRVVSTTVSPLEDIRGGNIGVLFGKEKLSFKYMLASYDKNVKNTKDI